MEGLQCRKWGGWGRRPCVKVLSWMRWLRNATPLWHGHVCAWVPLLSHSRCSQLLAFRDRSGQVVINYWWVCHPNCALSSDHTQPFVWQRMPYKIFMHHLASLALSFFSRNIIALDAFPHFPKIFSLEIWWEQCMKSVRHLNKPLYTLDICSLMLLGLLSA